MSPLETASPSTINIQIWEKLELQFGTDKNTGQYFARVNDITSEGIVIDRPIWLSGEPVFSTSGHFTVSVFRDDGAYRFNSRILREYEKGDRRYYVLKPPEKMFRHQRRSYVRVEINFPVEFKLLNDVISGEVEYSKAREFIGSSINLSASGVLVNTLKLLEVGDMVAMKLKDNGVGFDFHFLGIVRRKEELAENRVNVGVEFIVCEDADKHLKPEEKKRLPDELFVLNERKRQRLVQYVFNYQIEMRKKGLL